MFFQGGLFQYVMRFVHSQILVVSFIGSIVGAKWVHCLEGFHGRRKRHPVTAHEETKKLVEKRNEPSLRPLTPGAYNYA
jgi:hypothetical protein